MKVKGLHERRFRDSPEEKRFADAWEAQNEKRREDFLGYLLSPTVGTAAPISERDRVVAATVIQWLGSPVGQAFLRDMGYERKT